MNNESLQEELNIPMLGGTLIAECDLNEYFINTRVDGALKALGLQPETQLERMFREEGKELPLHYLQKRIEGGEAARKETIIRTEELHRKFSDPSNIENYKLNWRVAFLLVVPDRRYNSAGVSFYEDSLPHLIQDLETSRSIIKHLQSVSLSGTYLKSISDSSTHKVEVTGTNEQLGLRFSVSNEQRWLSVFLSLKQVQEAIEKLKDAQQRGPELLDALRIVKSISSQ